MNSALEQCQRTVAQQCTTQCSVLLDSFVVTGAHWYVRNVVSHARAHGAVSVRLALSRTAKAFWPCTLHLCGILCRDKETVRCLSQQRILYRDKISLSQACVLCRTPNAAWPRVLNRVACAKDVVVAGVGTTMLEALSRHALLDRNQEAPTYTQPCRDRSPTIAT